MTSAAGSYSYHARQGALYKTRLCKFGNRCTYGGRCFYAHSADEIRPRSIGTISSMQSDKSSEVTISPNTSEGDHISPSMDSCVIPYGILKRKTVTNSEYSDEEAAELENLENVSQVTAAGGSSSVSDLEMYHSHDFDDLLSDDYASIDSLSPSGTICPMLYTTVASSYQMSSVLRSWYCYDTMRALLTLYNRKDLYQILKQAEPLFYSD